MQTPTGYETSDGQFVDSRDVVLHSSSARTASGSGSLVKETGYRRTIALTLVASAASGTSPTLDVTVQTSRDGITWRTHDSFPQVTAAGTVLRSTGGLDRFVRVAWTIGGTAPSFTFSVSGELV